MNGCHLLCYWLLSKHMSTITVIPLWDVNDNKWSKFIAYFILKWPYFGWNKREIHTMFFKDRKSLESGTIQVCVCSFYDIVSFCLCLCNII